MSKSKLTAAALLAALLAEPSVAAVSAEDAKSLGGPVLTFIGAEKAGNKEGTIPDYLGEVIKAPAGYDAKNAPGNLPDPWNEKPVFAITAQNADKYADKLQGMTEFFKKYPNYRMDIYPTHRTTSFPKYVLDNTVRNATSCKAVQNELVLEGCYGGYPFPIPRTGAQVMWNHLLAHETRASVSKFENWIITAEGSQVLQNKTVATQNYPYYDAARSSTNAPRDIYWQARLDTTEPARKAGEKIVLIDAVDFLNVGRRAYQYIPGQRRVKLAPDISYDTPSPIGGGLITSDDSKLFIGAIDRYDWKLIGKKEKFIPYNNFKATDYKACPAKLLMTRNFPNPDCIRWELHRVWVVEATLKPSFRHIYKRRMFYFDEDGYYMGLAENYDAAGKLWRINITASHPFFDVPGNASASNYVSDLQTGAWMVQGMVAERGLGTYPIAPVPSEFFSPEALAGEGIR